MCGKKNAHHCYKSEAPWIKHLAHKSEDPSWNPPAPTKSDTGLQVTVLFYFEVRVGEGGPQPISGYAAQQEAPEMWSHYREKGRQDQHPMLPLTSTRMPRHLSVGTQTQHTTHTL